MAANQEEIFFQAAPLGQATVENFVLPENARVESAVIELAGEAYVGNLNTENFGTTVSQISGTEFIVDFHSFRTIYAVSKKVSGKTVNEVNMWFGSTFFTQATEGSINPNLLLNIVAVSHPEYRYFQQVVTSKIKVKLANSLSLNNFKNNFKVISRSYPLNLRARIGNEDPFWAYPGEFATRASLPEFVDALNRYQETCNNGECTVPLNLFSDTPGSVRVHAKKIGYHLEKVLLNEQEMSKLQLQANTSVKVKLSSPPLGQPGDQIQLTHFGFDLKGIIFSNIGVKISPTFTGALRFFPDQDLQLTGFKILLGKEISPDLELFAELQGDKDGHPFADRVLVSSPIQITDTEIDQDFWFEVAFDEPVELKAEKNYWLVLKSKKGIAEWKAYPQTAAGQRGEFKYSKDAAQTWQDHHVTGYFLSISDPPVSQLEQFLKVKFTFQNKSVIAYAKDVAEPIQPISIENQRLVQEINNVKPINLIRFDVPIPITLIEQGKFNLNINLTSNQNGYLQLSNAFVKYFIS